MFVALVGVAAIWVHNLAGVIMACVDALAALLLVAGGIVSILTNLGAEVQKT